MSLAIFAPAWRRRDRDRASDLAALPRGRRSGDDDRGEPNLVGHQREILGSRAGSHMQRTRCRRKPDAPNDQHDVAASGGVDGNRETVEALCVGLGGEGGFANGDVRGGEGLPGCRVDDLAGDGQRWGWRRVSPDGRATTTPLDTTSSETGIARTNLARTPAWNGTAIAAGHPSCSLHRRRCPNRNSHTRRPVYDTTPPSTRRPVWLPTPSGLPVRGTSKAPIDSPRRRPTFYR